MRSSEPIARPRNVASVALMRTRSAWRPSRSVGGSLATVTTVSSDWGPAAWTPAVSAPAAIAGRPMSTKAATTAAPSSSVNRQPRTPQRAPVAARRQRQARLGRLVPVDRAVPVQDRRLVALAREEHDVARPRPLERGRDGLAPVRDREHVHAASGAAGLGAAHDRVDDRVAVLAPGILVRGDHEPAALGRDPAHRAPAWPCPARRPSRTRRSGRRRPRPRPARAGRARRRATPASARSRRSRRTAGPRRSAPSGRARPRPTPARRGPRPDPGRAPRRGRRPRARCGR